MYLAFVPMPLPPQLLWLRAPLLAFPATLVVLHSAALAATISGRHLPQGQAATGVVDKQLCPVTTTGWRPANRRTTTDPPCRSSGHCATTQHQPLARTYTANRQHLGRKYR